MNDSGIGTFIALVLMLVVLPLIWRKLTGMQASKLIKELPSLIITRGVNKRKVEKN